MRTFIQLRNNIGFAVLTTNGSEPDHSVTPEHTTSVEVFIEDPDSLLKKLYNPETKIWSDAPIYRIAEVNSLGDIVEIKRTVFEHEIDQDTIVMPDNIDFRWKYIDGLWVEPVFHEPVEEAAAVTIEEQQDGTNI